MFCDKPSRRSIDACWIVAIHALHWRLARARCLTKRGIHVIRLDDVEVINENDLRLITKAEEQLDLAIKEGRGRGYVHLQEREHDHSEDTVDTERIAVELAKRYLAEKWRVRISRGHGNRGYIVAVTHPRIATDALEDVPFSD